MTPDQERAYRRRRESRALVVALALGALAILFYAITVVRMVK